MQATAPLVSSSPRIIPWSRMGDESLAGRAAAGNQSAFAALYERYHGPLLGYCRSILLNEEDASDAAQNALENALRALPRREPGRPLRPWLYRIAHNEAINIVRRRQRVAEGALDTDSLLTVPGPEVDAEQRSRMAQLVDDLRSLPERQRGALVMRELSGLSYDEIGVALGISNEAARRAVFDARTALHAVVAGRATECTSVRRCLSDGDRRRLRARGVRAHLRACNDCASFERTIRTRQGDLHALGPWIGGTSVLGLLGLGGATAKAALVATGTGGGGLGWAGLPVAVKGFAVAAVVATTGTAAVELPEVARRGTPAPQARAAVAAAAGAPAAISGPHDALREQALAQAAAQRRARRARREAAARRQAAPARARAASATISTSDRGTARTRAIAPAPAIAQPHATSQPAAAARPAPAARTSEQLAAERLERIRAQTLTAFNDAQAIADTGTAGALATANALIRDTLASVGPLLDQILDTFGIEAPSYTAPTQTSTTSTPTTVTNVLAPAQNLLSGIDVTLQNLFGRR